MQYTPNYNLITVEGTDVVNPLVQMNPNFTDIDAAMFANKQAVIGTATEITVGTVHSITRANTDSNYFRFTATSNWTVGDSMSVDGVAVSVYLSDGTIPDTGAYIINSEVLALLSGSRVTLIVSSGSINANSVSYDNSGSGITATNVQDAIDEIVTNLQTHDIYELWVNPDTSSPFAAQNISLLTDKNIDTFLVEIGNGNVATNLISCEAGSSTSSTSLLMDTSNGKIIEERRTFSLSVTATGYNVSVSDNTEYTLNSYGSAATSATWNNGNAPIRILGIAHQ